MSGFGEKFERIESPILNNEATEISPESRDILKNLFADDFEEKPFGANHDVSVKDFEGENNQVTQNDVDLSATYEPNSKFEVNGIVYETDDNGKIYKTNGTDLVPNNEYDLGGSHYKTDEKGRIISCDSKPISTPEGGRDTKAQEQAGGEDRKPGDQGSHIIARIFGGAKGIENMLAIRDKINQGPYKSMEAEIKKALEDGKEVDIHCDVEYEGDSERPSKITVTYRIDGKETTVIFDNDEGSVDLLNNIENLVDEDSYNDLLNEVNDAKENGDEVSVLSVKVEKDEDGNVVDVTVVVRYEGEDGNGYNDYRHLAPKEGS